MENTNNSEERPQEETQPTNSNAITAKLAAHDDATIPQWVYDSLPPLLKDSCSVFNDPHERDAFFTGTLAILGGCYHNLYAYNEPDKKKVASNLLTIIVAPPASGKGALNYARKMGKQIKETFKANTRGLGKTGNKLFIPANISSSGMVQLLSNNNGIGVMVESEIDTIVNANKQEWGNYSEIIRKSFENEEYSLYRKGKDKSEHYEIESLKLSVAISGTPQQFKSLIYSSENGLFSRGTYYVFESADTKLKFTERMRSDTDVETKFAGFARIANNYYVQHLAYSEIRVHFSKKQLEEIGNVLQAIKDRLDDGFDLDANIKRSFVMAQKIAAILSFLFECERNSLTDVLKCPDDLLDVAIWLIGFYLCNAYNALEMLPSKASTGLNNGQKRLLLLVPEEFTRTEAVRLGVENGMSQRNAYYAFIALERKGLVKIQDGGKYKKQ